MQTIKFVAKNENQQLFAKTLAKNVRNYFKENNISTKGGYRMIIKAIVMLGLYFTPFILILTIPMPAWFAVIMLVVMGIGEAGIGMGIMHDAVHGSFSRHYWINNLMGRTMVLLGSNVLNWKIQHNIYHHTYTNIFNWDSDIETKAIIRLSKHAPLKKVQRYQHFYSYFLYGLMTIAKFAQDFGILRRHEREGTLKALDINYRVELFFLILTKIIYLGIIFVLPLLVTDFTWWQILLGILIMHSTASLIMSTVFQMAHVIPELDQPLPDKDGIIHNDKQVHMLTTTADFGKFHPIFGWYIGGLDYQVEHHLFPNVCHIHYSAIAPIVQKTAEEFQMPYHRQKSFLTALSAHIKMLKLLGEEERSESLDYSMPV